MRHASPLLALVLLTFGSATLSAISTIKAIRITEGYDTTNRLTAPVVDPARAPALRFALTAGYDRNAKIVRRGATGMFTRGPEYNLDKAVDVAAIFTEVLRTEAGVMGFKAGGTDGAWSVEGSVRNVYLESKQIPYGATLFYGYLTVDLEIRHGADAPTRTTMSFHDYVGGYNAGVGRRDEAESALAHLLVEAAQDLVARLNRTMFKAAPHPELASLVGRIAPKGLAADSAELHRIGLAGTPEATAGVLKWLAEEADENHRSALTDVLADLGDPAAVAVLAARYSTEDEDCRWFTLKAMDYIGGEPALALVRDRGLRDADGGPRRLAERITNTKPR